MKKIAALSVTLFFVTVTMSFALELVPMPAEMRQGTREVRLRSTEPLVEITDCLQSEEYHLEITEDGQIVLKAGSSKAANIVLMARVAKYFDIPYEKWIAAIEKTVAPRFVEMNKKAFELGYHHC